MTALVGVPAADVATVWPDIEGEIARACAKSDGRYESDDVRAALLAREMQLWVSLEAAPHRFVAACVTEIVDYPRERRCGLAFCAGRGPERWLHHLDGIGDWARGQGCAALEVQGRPGWEKLLQGWTKTHVLLRKRI